jgi:hypothetical protein
MVTTRFLGCFDRPTSITLDFYALHSQVNIYSKKTALTRTTKIVKKTLNPIWNEEFIFKVLPQQHKLVNIGISATRLDEFSPNVYFGWFTQIT